MNKYNENYKSSHFCWVGKIKRYLPWHDIPINKLSTSYSSKLINLFLINLFTLKQEKYLHHQNHFRLLPEVHLWGLSKAMLLKTVSTWWLPYCKPQSTGLTSLHAELPLTELVSWRTGHMTKVKIFMIQ